MKKQAFNPYLPSYEYVPDGEPYVFGDRLYVYGSHDAFGGKGYCVNDYVCYSAPVDDLGDWRYEGVIYRRTQDPVNPKGNQYMNAPDVCQGPDGRYYLYYQLQLQNTTSVAVSEKPGGPFEYYGVVKHQDGRPYGLKKDAYNFDPGVLLDDDGKIYMYTGFSPDSGLLRFVMGLRGGTYNGGSVVELEPDMLTLAGKEVPTIPGKLCAAGTEFEEHPFFEASSIRKINGIYYLVYSSVLSHELCYATSSCPLGPWKYGGTIVSNGDIGLPGVTAQNARNFIGNTHGGMVCVKGQWYIFYHRQTNQQRCARQGCAEKITIEKDGSIKQAEMTSCGLNDGPLRAAGAYEARIACNLWGAKGTFSYDRAACKETEYPYFTQTGTDRESMPDQYIANMRDGATAGFKYFDFDENHPEQISVEVRGRADGKLCVYTEPGAEPVAEIPVTPSLSWKRFTAGLAKLEGVKALYFTYRGTGYIDFKSFEL
ncbi:MAG: family 43 glycosylhydrolase [Roseburia sp.]|nr:family 43 glycosylhydrolase [Roseburia sp.]MCM1099311.1 family 43 glycosylhydrolase [Ruminococcus flavefaciens]